MSKETLRQIESNVPKAWIPSLDSPIKRANNAEVWDQDGKRYLDYVGGYAVLNTGHVHPKVIKRVQNQLKDFTHSCFAYAPHQNAIDLCSEINIRYPINGDTKTFLVNSGAEAVENAIKIARYYSGKQHIIAFKGGFHGRTYMAMGLTGKENPYKKGFGPFPDFISHTEFPYHYRGLTDEKALELLQENITKVNRSNIAAILMEIQLGEGGYIPASKNFLKKVRKIADDNNILLIFDEVQTGYGRTGQMFGANTVGVTPDMATLAKGIGGGFPLAAVVGRSEIMDSIHDAGIGSTFGASPVSCAAALGVLEVFDQDNLLQKAINHAELMNGMLSLVQDKNDFIGDVRGYGTMIGVEIVTDKKLKNSSKELAMQIIDTAKNNGLLLVNCGLEGNVIRFMGPLTTPVDQVKEAMEIFSDSVNSI
ncbi:MAG: aspartate aminotransferase family protein [Candidatus Actinomarina sp.]|nr:aspartate aminotransferase family protein [Candidatus Actinomarina sp.]MDB2326487.1 aspartate aminotransferase family protein [Candidatus Actinomarina sp.]